MRAVLVVLLASMAGCGAVESEPVSGDTLSYPGFVTAVQPVIDRECAFPACHGTPDRFLTLYAKNRYRVSPETHSSVYAAPINEAELLSNMAALQGFADPGEHPDDTMLMRKSLAQSAGGYYHGIEDLYGSTDVFLSKSAGGYQAMADWLSGEQWDGTCGWMKVCSAGCDGQILVNGCCDGDCL